ncbi:MAG: methyltransferase domain-containing protein [Cyclobacteriaceae bacterium]|nr:methyltransferase domain-containing protein [Cyclobacteriaceae bacterium]
MPDFSNRSSAIEIMDDLDCHGEVVDQTLRELEFINRWLGGNAVTLEGIKKLFKTSKKEKLHIADLGCGGGDMLKLLADWGRRNNISLQLTGIDANPHIIAFAKNNCQSYPEISFETLDIFSSNFESRKFDIVMGTLFYHHFSQQMLIDFFTKLRHQVNVGIIINDIHRHWLAYHSIRLLTKFFSKSAMVKFDAPLSVLRAFTKREMIDILNQSGLVPFKLKWKWAFRWLTVYAIK